MVITTITPITTLVILVTSTQHAHLTLRVSLRLAKRPSAETVDTDQNCVVERGQLQECGYLSNLITSFEEEYIWLEVQSVWLIWKQKEGNGFQDWHIDLANNGQTVYTICVNLGSLELQAVNGEITNLNVDVDAYAPDVDAISPLNNSDGNDGGVTNSDDDGEAKQANVGDSE